MIYILLFFISLMFLFIGSRTKNKIISLLTTFIGLILPCIIAGLRNSSVGTDTSGYVKKMYELAVGTNSFKEYTEAVYKWYLNKDYFYLFNTYICSKLNHGFQYVLFMNQVLAIFPIYLASYRYYKNRKISLVTMIFYFLTFYNLSFNMARQSIAISFFVLSFAIYTTRRNKKDTFLSILFFILSVESHNTAIITAAIYLLYAIINSKSIDPKVKTCILFILNTLLLVSIFLYKPIFEFLGTSGIYKNAINYIENHSRIDFNESSFILNIFILILIIYYKKKFTNNKINFCFVLEIGIINLILNLIGTFVKYSNRIVYYVYYLILFVYLPSLFMERKKNKVELIDLFVIMLILYFIIYTLYFNNNQTLPYVFWRKT